MMVADIDERMTADEFIGWQGFAGSIHSPGAGAKTASGIMAELAKHGVLEVGHGH